MTTLDISFLKRTILEENKIVDVLERIGCHSIEFHSGNPDDFYTCANKNGDNKSAITVYCNDNLKCINYTRELNVKKESHDIIDLVMFNEEISFFQAIKFLCDIVEINYYSVENEEDVPESIKMVWLVDSMCMANEDEYIENTIVEPKPEYILNYYRCVCNDIFAKDNVSYYTQAVFELGYDDERDMITIPIRDELGNLVGVKARTCDMSVVHNKYTYLIGCPRGKILYNLFRSYESIVELGYVIVVESEKACMQLYDMGIYNTVALSGSKLTAVQRQKLMNLHVDIVFALDKDVTKDKLQSMANKFPLGYKISAIIDTKDILNEKESPSDDPFKWEELWDECMEVL